MFLVTFRFAYTGLERRLRLAVVQEFLRGRLYLLEQPPMIARLVDRGSQFLAQLLTLYRTIATLDPSSICGKLRISAFPDEIAEHA